MSPTHPTMKRLIDLRARLVSRESVSFHDVVELIDLMTEGRTTPEEPTIPAAPVTGGDPGDPGASTDPPPTA